jgi:hypothetical protein
VRKAALDIQRCYRGMLGREDAAWHRLQRKKKLKAQQVALDAKRRREATALLLRCYRGHRGRLQARWRRRMRAEREESCRVLQAAVRRLGGRKHLKVLREEGMRELAAALLQAHCATALMRARLAQHGCEAARCLQRAARWALSKTQLAVFLQRRAASILAAASVRVLARHVLGNLQQEELERREAQAKREADWRQLARQAAASTVILGAWRQRRARCAAVRALAARRGRPTPDPSYQPPPSYQSPSAAAHTPCALLAALETEVCSIASASSPEIGSRRLMRLLGISAALARRKEAASMIRDAWRARAARLVCELRRAAQMYEHAAQVQRRRIASALLLQTAWQRRCLLRAARRRAATAAEKLVRVSVYLLSH